MLAQLLRLQLLVRQRNRIHVPVPHPCLVEMQDYFVNYLLIRKQKVELVRANRHLPLRARISVDVVDVLKVHVHLILVPLQPLMKLLCLFALHFFWSAVRLLHELRIEYEAEAVFDWFVLWARSRDLGLLQRWCLVALEGERRLRNQTAKRPALDLLQVDLVDIV